jgi:hypothetical protein
MFWTYFSLAFIVSCITSYLCTQLGMTSFWATLAGWLASVGAVVTRIFYDLDKAKHKEDEQ